MKSRIGIVLLVLCVISVLFTGCQQKSDAPVTASKQEAPPAPPPPPSPGAQKTDEPSLEVKSHLKQGMSYVSVAKNATNTSIFNENIDNAINEFSNAIKKDTNYAEAYSNRAVAYMMQKKYNKALDDLKKAKELKPDSANIRYNLAACHSLMGNVDYGLDELDAALARGFNAYDALRKDPDIANLRKHKEFKTILEKHKVFITQ